MRASNVKDASARKHSHESVAHANKLGLKNPKVLISLLLALLAVAIAGIIWFSNTNATGALSQVNFPKVSIAEGSKFYLNGGKSLTAIKEGELLADNTNGTAVEGSQISNELSNFANSQYGNDAGKNYLTNPNLLSLEKLNNSLHLIPATDSDYWLETIGNRGQISWRWYAKLNNSTSQNKTIKVSGKDLSTGEEFEDDIIATGQIGITNTFKLSDYQVSEGGKWSLDNNTIKTFKVYYCSRQFINQGDTVYNNIELKSSGVDPNGHRYASTTVNWMSTQFGTRIFGYIKNGRIIQVKPGDKIPAGTIAMYCFYKPDKQLKDPTYFAYSGYSYTAFKQLTKETTVSSYVESQPVYGVTKYYTTQTTIPGTQLTAEKYAIRPTYSYDVSKIAYVKDNVSSAAITSQTLGAVPTTNATNNQKYKAVVKSTNTTITNNITADKLSTDRTSGSGNRPSVKLENDIIKVPYASKKLTLSNCFTTNNSTHISALAENGGDKKYGVLAQSSASDITLDLTNLLANTQVGSNCTISFFAEKVNGTNTSDEISDKAVTVKLEVVEGAEQTITYDSNGGTGTVPAVAKANVGKVYNFADGSNLSKDGNSFSCWQVTYTDFDTKLVVKKLFKSNEPIFMPDSLDGNITALALYSGISANKTTQSTSSVYTVTWNANLPEGVSITSWAGASQLSDDMTKNYQKVKLKGSTVALSPAPTINTSTWVFDGWYDAATGGNKLSGQTLAINKNVTYYAHWLNGYTVTFDINAPSGQTCKWGSTTSPNTLTSLAKPTAYVIENPSGVSGSPTCTSDAVYGFDGWYDAVTGGNLIEIGTSTVSGNKTIYAHWTKDVFLAKVSGTNFDPTKTSTYASADITSIADVKAAATTIANGGTNPNTTKYNATNDQYHLFARIGGSSTSTTANDWLECRIIHVGQHDGDGSGLTFQAVHAWNTGYRWDTSWSDGQAPNWSNCTLRTTMNSTIYNTLLYLLKTNIKQVTKKSNATAGTKPNGGSTVETSDKLFILSYTEFVKNSTSSLNWDDASHDGSVYQFWSSKDLSIDSHSSSGSTQQQLLYKLNCDRSGNLIKDSSWLRSVDPYESYRVLEFLKTGYVASRHGSDPSVEYCISPSFAM